VIGDAVCAFNPVYGQGMTVGAQGALELHRCLRDQRRRRPDGDLTGLAQRFRQQLAKINATPWMLATGEDFRYPGTEGGRPGRVTRLLHRYMDRVMISATKNPAVHRAFIEVLHLLKPATALFQPSIAIQVLGGSYQPARAGRL
jgi:2-polyprenyl-6-methoxyphenol hydroxylase-like FAD-dependent oxidoreductase